MTGSAVNTVGQILANYQAALHLLEETVGNGDGETVPPDEAAKVLRDAVREIFTPVLDACAGAAPGLEELVTESIGGERPEAAEHAPRDLVIAERGRIAITHSRLIKRQAALTGAPSPRLDELETGSHSAGALFRLLVCRWPQAKVLSSD